ncbi:MAG: cupin domain-containing protein [Leeuwenhoekiella sp.]
MTAQQLIHILDLQEHPEGGFYRETYRSDGSIPASHLAKTIDGERNFSTCIYFLLTAEKFSAFHKINQDEIWHFYQGSPIKLHSISPNGKLESYIIGPDILNGEHPQLVVPAGCWFAAEVNQGGDFALMGCTVSPGFDFEDFQLAQREELSQMFPKHNGLIVQFTRQ